MALFSRPDYVKATVCGHSFPISGKLVDRDGNNKKRTILAFDLRSKSLWYCIKCMWLYRALCAWCFEWIPLGYGVTLYTPAKSGYHLWVPQPQTAFTRMPLRVIGCMKCADDPSHIAGYWLLRPGRDVFVERLPDTFVEQKGTIAVSYYNRPSDPDRHTARMIVAPIPLVGNRIQLHDFLIYETEQRTLKVVPTK